MFLLEPFLAEPVAELFDVNNATEGVGLSLHIASFQTDDSVGQGVVLVLGDILAHNLHQVGQGHDSTTDDEIISAFLVLATEMFRVTVLQSDGITYLLCHTDFLSCSVNQLELTFGEENGQGNAGESATCPEVEDAGAWCELNHLGNS